MLAKREAAGDAAGFDRLRAEREVLEIEADRAAAGIERARAQGTLSGFFTDVTDPSRLTAVGASTAPAAVPPVAALVEQAETTRGEMLALRHEIDAARFSERAADRRLIPEPEIVAGTKSSTAGGGDRRQRGHGARHDSTVRSRAPRARARARQGRSGAKPGSSAFRLTLRGQIAALRAVVVERRAAAERYRAEAIRQRGSNRAHCAGQLRRRRAGDSGTARRLPSRRQPPGSGRRRSTPPSGRQRSSSNS